MFRLKPANRNSIFIALENLKVFFKEFHSPTLDKNYHLLVKFLAKVLVKTSMLYVQDLQHAFCSQYCT